MNRQEFLRKIIQKKKIDKEIYDLTKDLRDFDMSREILIRIDNSIQLDAFLNAPSMQRAIVDKGDLYRQNISLIKDSFLRSESKKFLDDLLDLKILDFRSQIVNKSKSIKSDNEIQTYSKTPKEKKKKGKNPKIKILSNDIYLKGEKYLKQSEYQNAKKCFNSLIKSSSDWDEANKSHLYFKRGLCNLYLEIWLLAIRDFTEALIFEEVPEYYYFRGLAKNGSSKYKDALNDFEIALSYDSKQDKYKVASNFALKKLDEQKQKTKTEKESKNNISQFNLIYEEANILFENEEYNKAKDFYTYIIDSEIFEKWTKNEKGEILNARGLSYSSIDRYGPAYDDFSRAISLNAKKNCHFLYWNRAECSYHHNKYSLAIDDLDKAIINFKDPYFYYLRGLCKKLLADSSYSNKNLVKLKLEKYEDSLEDVNFAINNFSFGTVILEKKNIKIKDLQKLRSLILEVIVENKITDNNLSRNNNILYSDKRQKKMKDVVGYTLIVCFTIIIGIWINPFFGLILLLLTVIGHLS